MTYEQLGKIIKQGREARNMTQQDLAQKLGVGISAVSNWETGLRAPRVLEFLELVRILGLGEHFFVLTRAPINQEAYKTELELVKEQLNVLQQRVNMMSRVEMR